MKNKISLAYWAIAIVIALLSGPINAYAAKVTYDLPIMTSTQSWGVLGENCAAHDPAKEPFKLKIGEKVYDKGIGTHANSVIDVDLLGKYETFNAEIGVQSQPDPKNNAASVIFKVLVDGDEKFKSEAMTGQSPAQKISVPVNGEYILNPEENGKCCIGGRWAENCRIKKFGNRSQNL